MIEMEKTTIIISALVAVAIVTAPVFGIVVGYVGPHDHTNTNVLRGIAMAHAASVYFTGDETPGAETVALGVNNAGVSAGAWVDAITVAHNAAVIFTGDNAPGAEVVAAEIVA